MLGAFVTLAPEDIEFGVCPGICGIFCSQGTHLLLVPDLCLLPAIGETSMSMGSPTMISLSFSLFLSGVFFHTIFCTPVFNMPALTVVLVPGAFHVASVMDILGARLQEKGYNTRTWGLKTVDQPNVSVEEDSKLLAEGILNPLIKEQGKDVVLYLHSYAGFPGSAAIAGLSKAERIAKGQQGGIIGLIFQSAFVPKPGNTLLQMIGGNYAPWQDPDVSPSLLLVLSFLYDHY